MLWWLSMLWPHGLHPHHTCLLTLPLLLPHLPSLPPCQHPVFGEEQWLTPCICCISQTTRTGPSRGWSFHWGLVCVHSSKSLSQSAPERPDVLVPQSTTTTHSYNAWVTFGTGCPWKRGNVNFKTRMKISLCTGYPNLAGKQKHAAPVNTRALCLVSVWCHSWESSSAHTAAGWWPWGLLPAMWRGSTSQPKAALPWSNWPFLLPTATCWLSPAVSRLFSYLFFLSSGSGRGVLGASQDFSLGHSSPLFPFMKLRSSGSGSPLTGSRNVTAQRIPLSSTDILHSG